MIKICLRNHDHTKSVEIYLKYNIIMYTRGLFDGGYIEYIFTGIGAIVIGIFLGFIIALIIGAVVYGIIKLRDRMEE